MDIDRTMVEINNPGEANYIKSFIIPITQPHVLDMGENRFRWRPFWILLNKKNPSEVPKWHPLDYWSGQLEDSKKPMKHCITPNTTFNAWLLD